MACVITNSKQVFLCLYYMADTHIMLCRIDSTLIEFNSRQQFRVSTDILVSHDDTKPLFFYSVGGSKNHKGGVFEGVLTKSSRETPKILRSLLKLRPKLLTLIISFFAQLFHFHNIVNEEIFSPCSGTVFCEWSLMWLNNLGGLFNTWLCVEDRAKTWCASKSMQFLGRKKH